MQWQIERSSSDPVFFGQDYYDRHSPPKNKNSIKNLPSRPAKELFKDFMNRLVTLELIPFNQYSRKMLFRGYEEYEDLKLLFQIYGWPEKSDGASFDSAAKRWKEFDKDAPSLKGHRTKSKACGF